VSVRRIFAATMVLVSCLLAIQSNAVAQQRVGVRPNANPPEGCYIIGPVEPESISSFLTAQIQALSLAHRGELANIKMLETKGSAPFEDKTITGLREERLENYCASYIISYYSDSKNPTIATIAKFLTSAYDEFGEMSDQMLGINLQKFLRRPIGPSPQRQFSLLMERRQEIFQNMADAITLSLSLLIDEDRTDPEAKPDHLILNKAEVNDLLDYLHIRFPALKDSPGVVLQGDFAKQAASIQTFFKSGYRPADLP
jgi:hypothetical protein